MPIFFIHSWEEISLLQNSVCSEMCFNMELFDRDIVIGIAGTLPFALKKLYTKCMLAYCLLVNIDGISKNMSAK